MKLKFSLLAGAVIAGLGALSTWAQSEPLHGRLGADKPFLEFAHIQIKNLQDESLGRVKDVGIDLINGRIVEVLVASDSSLGVGAKIVAVPPGALLRDPLNEVYRLNVSTDVFKNAPAIDLSQWTDAGRSDHVAAAYRLFAQEPYFLEEGATASPTASRPKVALGYVELSSKIVNLPVGNLQNEKLGKVWSMTLDFPQGRILSVIVIAQGNSRTKSIIPAMALSFNPTRDALLLDDTKLEYADEPRYIFTEAAFGQKAYSKEESYEGPHTSVALEQGSSYRDLDMTVRINQNIRAAHINGRNVQVGTINDRVTLRGWTDTNEDKRRIGEIAIAAARLELVDNQILVGKPVTTN
jgi:sporulation protein YlmC with PRC-barrel domain